MPYVRNLAHKALLKTIAAQAGFALKKQRKHGIFYDSKWRIDGS
jgi:hypothetical protein